MNGEVETDGAKVRDGKYVVLENIPTHLMEDFLLWTTPPLQPQGKFHFSLIVFFKNSGFRIYPPTLRMYNDLPWDVYGYFMELYNVQFLAPLVIYCVKFLIREGGVMQGLG